MNQFIVVALFQIIFLPIALAELNVQNTTFFSVENVTLKVLEAGESLPLIKIPSDKERERRTVTALVDASKEGALVQLPILKKTKLELVDGNGNFTELMNYVTNPRWRKFVREHLVFLDIRGMVLDLHKTRTLQNIEGSSKALPLLESCELLNSGSNLQFDTHFYFGVFYKGAKVIGDLRANSTVNYWGVLSSTVGGDLEEGYLKLALKGFSDNGFGQSMARNWVFEDDETYSQFSMHVIAPVLAYILESRQNEVSEVIASICAQSE